MTQHVDDLVKNRHLLSREESSDVFAKAYAFQKVIGSLRETGSYPYFQPLSLNLGPQAILKGKKVIMMGSNNYLGLTTHPKVREAAIEAIQRFGTSATGSRLLNGSLEIHEAFEHEIAQFLNKEAALIFTTGYQANLGAITALATHGVQVYLDKQNHASLYDAVKMSEGRCVFFKHNDADHLDRLMAQAPAGSPKLVAVDGVFSMEGDLTPLPNIVEVCRRHHARLLVDDAHALGVLGKKGEGTAGHFGLSSEVDLIMATFSKSLASTGGYVAGDFAIVDYIKHHGRSMIFSASITPANLAAARESLQILIQEPERVTQVMENARVLKEGLIAMGWSVGASQTPIIPVHIGNDLTALTLWKDLLEAGVYVNPVVYPAVDQDKAILRVSTMTTHTPQHLEQALEAFRLVGERYHLLEKQASHGA